MPDAVRSTRVRGERKARWMIGAGESHCQRLLVSFVQTAARRTQLRTVMVCKSCPAEEYTATLAPAPAAARSYLPSSTGFDLSRIKAAIASSPPVSEIRGRVGVRETHRWVLRTWLPRRHSPTGLGEREETRQASTRGGSDRRCHRLHSSSPTVTPRPSCGTGGVVVGGDGEKQRGESTRPSKATSERGIGDEVRGEGVGRGFGRSHSLLDCLDALLVPVGPF